MAQDRPKVYEGYRPYIFVSYAHADDDVVLPLIGALVAEGYRVWYDAGIELAQSFPDYIADHVHDCACFVPLISPASLRSSWCRMEMEYAIDLQKRILPIYLEDVELNRSLYMQLSFIQSLHRPRFASDAELYAELFKARVLDSCLTEEGRRRRGMKPRIGTTATGSPSTEVPSSPTNAVGNQTTHPEHNNESLFSGIGVSPRNLLAEYSWGELKLLSRAIAAAPSDVKGLEIAGAYRLVDQDGRLRGDVKNLALNDKFNTKASVRILGFRHDDLAGGGRTGITFEFADVPITHPMDEAWTNAGGWEESGMRKWLNADFLALLPEDLTSNMVKVVKKTNNRGRVVKDDTSSVTATHDKLWLLSMIEVYGGFSTQRDNMPWSAATYDAEGVQYQLYVDKSVTTTSYYPCAKEGFLSWWWLRSPLANGSHSFHRVIEDGGWNGGYSDADGGVSPGFCF